MHHLYKINKEKKIKSINHQCYNSLNIWIKPNLTLQRRDHLLKSRLD